MEQLLDLDFLVSHAPLVLSFALVLGLAVGSFLNVLALRSLKEESVLWPPSYCPVCNHALSAFDNLPVLSWFLLGGKCRHCKAAISWQYPLVELVTALSFVAITWLFLLSPIPYDPAAPDLFAGIARGLQARHDGATVSFLSDWRVFGLTAGMLAFACTLITVTVTDFREKLIPHEITYPSMIIGIAFSALVRQDLLGAMAGIGASYIIFDFLAFYGLKVYMKVHGSDEDEPIDASNDESPEGLAEAQSASVAASEDSVFSTAPSSESVTKTISAPDLPADLSTDVAATAGSEPGQPLPVSLSKELPLANENDSSDDNEPIEVMGGGDAVLSAVMSAYLGWQLLVVALCIGFLTGTVMGLALLFVEMKKAKLLRACFARGLKFAAIAGVGLALLMGGLMSYMQNVSGAGEVSFAEAWQPVFMMSLMGAAGGALLGMVSVGTRVSKPFPFGPALAFGAFVAMFLIPKWLPFY